MQPNGYIFLNRGHRGLETNAALRSILNAIMRGRLDLGKIPRCPSVMIIIIVATPPDVPTWFMDITPSNDDGRSIAKDREIKKKRIRASLSRVKPYSMFLRVRTGPVDGKQLMDSRNQEQNRLTPQEKD